MKKQFHKRTAWLLCLLAGLLLLPMQAMAAEIVPDTDAALNVYFTPNDLKADGVEFRIYRVASVTADCKFVYADAFADCGVSLESPTAQTWTDLATMLPAKVAADSIAPTATGKTGADGFAAFSQQKTGLYLVLGDNWQHEGVVYSPVPFLVVVPDRQADGNWDYDVEVVCKWTSVQAGDTLDLEVLKVWDDDENPQRPESVQVELYDGSTLQDTVTLSKDNDWRHTWTGLRAEGQWSVREKEVPADYTASVEQQDGRFVITNRCENPVEDDPQLPNTGQIWWPMPVLFFLGAGLVILGLLIRRRANA